MKKHKYKLSLTLATACIFASPFVLANSTVNLTARKIIQKIDHDNDPNVGSEITTIQPNETVESHIRSSDSKLIYTFLPDSDSPDDFFLVKATKSSPGCVITISDDSANQIKISTSKECE